MSVRSILRSEPSESQRKLLWGGGYLVSATALLTLTTVESDHTVLRIMAVTLGIGFLGVVPGYLIRKALRIDESSVLLAVLNSVGLSVLYCVGLAVLVDTALVGVVGVVPGVRPAGIVGSLQGVTFVVTLIATTGLGLAYVVSHREWEPKPVFEVLGTANRYRWAVGLLTAIPALSVLGTHYVNEFGDGRVALAFVAVAALVPLLLRAKVIPRNVEAYAIFCVALGVLYHTALISPHIWGWDTHYEYGTALHFLQQGQWNPAYASSLTPLLTVTLYSGLFSEVTALPLDTVFKTVYPVLFALMPVGVYWLSYRLTADRSVAVLAPFFVIFYYGFFKVIPGKQAIGELFLVLVLVALIARGVTTFQRRVLVIGFFSALVFSHYATSLLLVLFLGAAYVTLKTLVQAGLLENRNGGFTFLRPGYILLFCAIWLAWFGLTANGVNLDRVASAGVGAIEGPFGQHSGRSGVTYVTRPYGSFLWTLYKGLHVVVIGLAGLGVLREGTRLLRRRTVDARGEYAVLASVAYAFVGASTVVTFNMGFDRTLSLGLVILAPLVVLGARWSVRSVASRVRGTPAPEAAYATAVAVFLIAMFVFSSGAVFAVAGEDVPEYSIGLDEQAGFPVYTQEEVTATRWASEHLPACAKIGVYSDRSRPNSRDGLLLGEVVPKERIETIPPDRTTAGDASYMYVSDRPLDQSDDLGSYIDPTATAFHSEVLVDATLVYSRGPARIYQLGSRPECAGEETQSESLGERLGSHSGERARSKYASRSAGYAPARTATHPASPGGHSR